MRLGFHASHEQIAPSQLLADVEHAERAGFDMAMCSDHFSPWGSRQGHSGYTWAWLGAALARTDLELGCVCAPGQRYHPAVVAQKIATLAEMFPGRFWTALGSGEASNEHITGEPWPRKEVRTLRLEECVDVISRLLDGEEVSHDMQLFGRGLKRRFPPMVDGDPRRVRMAYSLMFSLPGTPTLYYGEEIGMGEDLAAPGRMAVRTPMQWSAGRNGGFSTATPSRLVQRVVPGAYGPEHVNVAAQVHDPDSLWSLVRKLISIRRTCPELGWGTWTVVEQPQRQVLVHRCDLDGSAVVTVHNLGPEPVTVEVPVDPEGKGLEATDLMSDDPLSGEQTVSLALDGYGFRWLRVRPAGDLAIP